MWKTPPGGPVCCFLSPGCDGSMACGMNGYRHHNNSRRESTAVACTHFAVAGLVQQTIVQLRQAHSFSSPLSRHRCQGIGRGDDCAPQCVYLPMISRYSNHRGDVGRMHHTTSHDATPDHPTHSTISNTSTEDDSSNGTVKTRGKGLQPAAVVTITLASATSRDDDNSTTNNLISNGGCSYTTETFMKKQQNTKTEAQRETTLKTKSH